MAPSRPRSRWSRATSGLNPLNSGLGISFSHGFPSIPTSQAANPLNSLLSHEFAIMNANPPQGDWGSSEYGGQWFISAIQALSRTIGVQQHRDLPDLTIDKQKHER